MATTKISAVIITYNEEANIGRCINSLLNMVDEILVVDSFSMDATRRIVESYGATFLQNSFEGHIQQKNLAMSKASFDHVLSLDADEALSDELRKEILRIRENWDADAYAFNRLNNYCGTFIRHGHWYPDRKIRLWDRRKGRWGGENPHDRVIMNTEATVKTIKADILHYTYKTPSEHLQQMNRFSDIAAREAFAKGKRTSVLIHLVIAPVLIFFKSFILRLGFMDGYPGFIIAYQSAYYRFLKYAKLKFLHGKKNP